MSNNNISPAETLDMKNGKATPILGGQSVRIFAPATVANVVCGFDVLGFAVNEPGDEVEMRLTDSPGVIIKRITGDDGKLPLDAAKNTVSASVQHYLQHINRLDVGVEIDRKSVV